MHSEMFRLDRYSSKRMYQIHTWNMKANIIEIQAVEMLLLLIEMSVVRGVDSSVAILAQRSSPAKQRVIATKNYATK